MDTYFYSSPHNNKYHGRLRYELEYVFARCFEKLTIWGKTNDLPIQVTATRRGNLAGALAAPADNFFRSRKFVSHDELCDVSFGELVIILTRRCLLLQAPLAPAASLHTSLRLRLWSHTWCRIMLPIIITVTNANFAMNDESHRALFSL